MHVTQQTIAQYEKAAQQPKLQTVRRLANALSVPINELILDWSLPSPSETFEDIAYYESDYEYFSPREEVSKQKIMKLLNMLNYSGLGKAIEQLTLLTEIPKYRKDSSEE